MLNITLKDNAASAAISGLNAGCDSTPAFLKEGTCVGKQKGSCVISGGNCSVAFIPTVGNNTYSACVDFDNDGDFSDAGENATATIQTGAGMDFIMIAIVIIVIIAIVGAVFWFMKSKKPKYNLPSKPSYTPPTQQPTQ
jgi:hypothetical protein